MDALARASVSKEVREKRALEIGNVLLKHPTASKAEILEKLDSMGLFSNTKESNFCKSYEEQRKRKKAPTQEEDSVDKVVEEHGEELIGCTVKIWWPIDKVSGRSVMEHAVKEFEEVLYEDGAHEILDLTEEHWELVEEEDNASLPIQEIVPGPSDLSDSDMPLVCFIRNIRKKKKGKATADPTTPSTIVAPFLDQPIKLLGKDPIMTDMKRCEKEKNGKIGWNDGAQSSSTSTRDSPEASEEDVATAEALLELGYAVSISKNSNLPESSKRPCKRKNFLSQEECLVVVDCFVTSCGCFVFSLDCLVSFGIRAIIDFVPTKSILDLSRSLLVVLSVAGVSFFFTITSRIKIQVGFLFCVVVVRIQRVGRSNFLAIMEAILAHLDAISQDMAKANAGLEKISSDMSTILERLEQVESRRNSRVSTPETLPQTINPPRPPQGKSTDDVCSERVDVHGYRVLACSAPILDAIFAKYGDIAENCHNKSPYTRGFLLDVVCDAVRELKTGAVRSSSVKAMKDIASVAKDANVDVTWLQQYLNEISEDEEMERTRRAEFLNSLFPTSSS
ncbi:hypothetical protein CQW23_11796 [Capsicum baccatum]|uniref:Uncharacterized protein n=1 Tax=Capsicum baccatum TaxID=33114 RepID=A0A2G2WQQ2_CAPBA|nr:hypothetical protein CQW23_11796 [Capsicum baccatum]